MLQGGKGVGSGEEKSLCFQMLTFLVSYLKDKPGNHVEWNEDEGRKIGILTSVPEADSDQTDLCSFAQKQL